VRLLISVSLNETLGRLQSHTSRRRKPWLSLKKPRLPPAAITETVTL